MSTNPGYEKRDANTRGVWIFVASLTVCVALICVAIGGLIRFLDTHPKSPVVATRIVGPGTQPPAPNLQVATQADMDKYRAAQTQLLQSYGWIDRDAGTVRIPIEDAMNLVAQRGIPSTDAKLTPTEMRQQKARTP